MPGYDHHTDLELVAGLQRSDEGAFAELYRRYWDRLLYWAAKKLGDLNEAENIVQDLFVDLWQRRDRLDIRGSVGAYIAVALKYRVINAQARARRVAGWDEQQVPADRSTENQLSFDELRDRLATLVAELPQQARLVYQLRDEGLSQKQIAAVLQISEHTVERHMSRALKAIRKGLSLLLHFLY